RHILLVDDEPHVPLLVRPLLERLGVSVQTARTLAEARRSLARQRPDGVLLDLHLPDGSGLDLLRELRAASDTRTLPVLVLTGEGDDRVLDEVERIGGLVLAKPFSPTKLSQRVLAVLGDGPGAADR
ncbi:MAG TPA: response regulator, partial [Pseudonocardia sp.]|nr:response regulator [Pseudonocardia sp.]